MECGLIVGAAAGSTGSFGTAAAAWAASVAAPSGAGAATVTVASGAIGSIGFGAVAGAVAAALGLGCFVAVPLGLLATALDAPSNPEGESRWTRQSAAKKAPRHPTQQKLKTMKAKHLHGTQIRQKPKAFLSKADAKAKAFSKFLERVGPSKQSGQQGVTPTLVQAALQQSEATLARSSPPRDGALADTSLIGLQVLGQGRFGRVYLSRLQDGQLCAVKVVGNTSATRGEIECMKAVSGHDGVVHLFNHSPGNVDATMMLLTLQYCNGGDLLGKQFFANALARLAHQLMRALKHVHACGYIHRDVKQDNILMCLPDSFDKMAFVVKLADFGCAARKEECVAPAGTRRMMGPELLLLCQAPCFKSDMWSAGYVLYAAVAGALPPSCLELVEEGWFAVPALKQEHREEGELFCDFLGMLLQEDRSARMSAALALQHPYMSPSASKS